MKSPSLPFPRRVVMIAFLVAVAGPAVAIGIRTHAEIGRMAVDTYLTKDGPVGDIAFLFEEDDNLRAFYAGCAFPDWGYGGIDPEASEFSHWHRFMETYLSVLQRRFPSPWAADAQRQICFSLGALCHDMADIPWHFDEKDHKSFLTAGREADGAGHSDIEFACDMFLYGGKVLEPAVGLGMWFPADTLLEVFEEAGQTVTRDQLVRGMFRASVMFWGGPLLGSLQYHRQKARMPWVYAHYQDYYYGGMEHDAAITAVMSRYAYARLNGDYYYQDTPLYSEYVRRSSDYVPRLQIEDATFVAGHPELSNDTGPYMEAGGAEGAQRYGLIRAALEDIPPGTEVERAFLWLHAADRVRSGDSAGVTVGIHALLKPWDAVYHGNDSHKDEDKQSIYEGPKRFMDLKPGSDFALEPVASAPLPGHEDSWIKLDISEIVSAWVADPSANQGLLLCVSCPDSTAPVIKFYASEVFRQVLQDNYGGGQIAFRPAIHIITRK